jgi:hypothetical protein
MLRLTLCCNYDVIFSLSGKYHRHMAGGSIVLVSLQPL